MEIAILVQNLEEDELERIYKHIPWNSIQILEEPSQAIVMVMAKDCFDVTFCLGEAVVWKAKVKFQDITEEFIIVDGDPKRALVGAVMKIVQKTVITDELNQVLNEVYSNVVERMEKFKKMVMTTRVDFETMPSR